MSVISTPWLALTDPAWFTCDEAADAARREETLRAWPSCPAADAAWETAVWRAMANVDSLWAKLAVHHALSELQRRGRPLDPSEVTQPLPAWLTDIAADIARGGAAVRRDDETLISWHGKLMGPVGVETLSRQVPDAQRRVHGAPLPAALVSGLRGSLAVRRFLNAKGESFQHATRRLPELRAKVLRGVLRWIERDMDGEERLAALGVGWAAAVWHREHHGKRGHAEQAWVQHLTTAVDLAERLLARHGAGTAEGRLAAAERALDAPWGNAVRVRAAETLALSCGNAWPPGSERVWARAMGVLGTQAETHWHHTPGAEGRHLIREGISAATAPLQVDNVLPANVVAATAILPTRWTAELLAQLWVSARGVGLGTEWNAAVADWLASAPAEDAAYWPAAVGLAWRPQDGPREAAVAEAKHLWLQAGLGQPVEARRHRARM